MSIPKEPLLRALRNVANTLHSFLNSEALEKKIDFIYGNVDTEEATVLIQELVDNLKSLRKKIKTEGIDNLGSELELNLSDQTFYIKFIPETTLGAYGAFGEQTKSIYFSEQANNAVILEHTMMEELGHLLDSVLNKGVDTPGDEGELFASIVLEKQLTPEKIARIKSEDDLVTITLPDGTQEKVELSSHTVANLVNTVDLSILSTPSPDPAGVTYINTLDRLFISDSEVNEMSIFTGDNIFELSLSGNLFDTKTTTLFADENEPTGIAFNPNNGHLFICDDDEDVIYEINAGADGQYLTADDVITVINTLTFGSDDPEGLTYASSLNSLFMAEGKNHEVFQIELGADGVLGGGDDTVSIFDTQIFGLLDPEGIAYNELNNNLYLVGKSPDTIYEVTISGTLVEVIDISAANTVKPGGLTFAPGSIDSNDYNLYLVDRGVDNNKDPNENDGKLHEFNLGFATTNPVAVNDSDGLQEGGSVVTAVLANDSDPNHSNSELTVTIASNPNNGTVTVNPDGTITYIHNGSETLIDSYTYTITDPDAQSDSATVVLTITPVNDSPSAFDDSDSAGKGASITTAVLANDFDPDNLNGELTVTIASNPNNGTVTVNPDGSITYTHDGSATFSDSYTYAITDPGQLSDTATVNLTIGAPPNAVDDSDTLSEGGSITTTVLANDSDPDHSNSQLTMTIANNPNNGNVTVNPDGTITYTHNGSETLSDIYTYTITDPDGLSDTATVNLTITAVNDSPLAVNDTDTVGSGASITTIVLANDSDPDNLNSELTVTIASNPNNGTVTVNPDGTITYTHDGSATLSDSYTYTITDPNQLSDTATVNLSITNSGQPNLIYVSTKNDGTVGAISFDDEDILLFNQSTQTWSMFFDGSDVGLGVSDIDINAFHVNDDGSILISINKDTTITNGQRSLTVDDSDILLFTPTSTGENTVGTWSMYFDGSDVELTSSGEDIDAIGLTPDGNLLISTKGSINVTGVSGGDEDLLVFNGTSLGDNTAGTFGMYFDGSDVGLDTSSEDINGVWVDDNENIYLSTGGAYNVVGASGDGDDIFSFTPVALGNDTSGSFASFWDGSANGLNGQIVGAISLA